MGLTKSIYIKIFLNQKYIYIFSKKKVKKNNKVFFFMEWVIIG